ncbi:hypothetical protein DPMN_103476 [Dreissena polymorpha]|uniref:Uncharacterized protein n=1 Tax=Dreissena polymorpha TaxID=45954 RepID=A0A9D3XZI7_DREPO|nr:hypothetical protein DPMN_191103 [Dreissena polymorpha]KAH3830236.1 hypothetical protein DPMN_103476 [Dreissena polymorpha]
MAAACHGSAFPLMIIVFGAMIDLFVGNAKYSNSLAIVDKCGGLSAFNLTMEGVFSNPESLVYV